MSITDPQFGPTTKYSSPVFLQVASCPASVWEFLDERFWALQGTFLHSSLPFQPQTSDPFQEEMEMTKTLLNVIYSLIYLLGFLFFSLDVREQGMGRDAKEPIRVSLEVGNSQRDQEIVAEPGKEAEGSVRERGMRNS